MKQPMITKAGDEAQEDAAEKRHKRQAQENNSAVNNELKQSSPH